MAKAVLIALVLAGCSAAPPKPDAARIATDTFAMTFDSAAARSDVEREARVVCGSKQWCKVLGWSDPALAAKAMPMTDREVAALKFDLTINRATGIDRMRWQ